MKDQPVYPQPIAIQDDGEVYTTMRVDASLSGLTLHQYYAGLAMQGLCANSIPGSHNLPKHVASSAVQVADELIKALEAK